jgi:hypothetical protein
VAAQDATLVDPFAVYRRVVAALRAARDAGCAQAEVVQAPNWASIARRGTRWGQRIGDEANERRFNEAVERATREPAPRDKLRGVAIEMSAMHYHIPADEDDALYNSRFPNHRPAVLSITVPGRPPYAVLVSRYSWVGRKHGMPWVFNDYDRVCLPALVSIGRRDEVKILWDEAPPAPADAPPEAQVAGARQRVEDGQVIVQAVADINRRSAALREWVLAHPGAPLPAWAMAIQAEARAHAAQVLASNSTTRPGGPPLG